MACCAMCGGKRKVSKGKSVKKLKVKKKRG